MLILVLFLLVIVVVVCRRDGGMGGWYSLFLSSLFFSIFFLALPFPSPFDCLLSLLFVCSFISYLTLTIGTWTLTDALLSSLTDLSTTNLPFVFGSHRGTLEWRNNQYGGVLVLVWWECFLSFD